MTTNPMENGKKDSVTTQAEASERWRRENTFSEVHSREMWEIYVPTVSNCGKPYRTRYHRVWDKKVREIAGGLTIYQPVIGQWVDEDNDDLYNERMIPVRIACDRDKILEIMRWTMNYYKQEAVMVTKVSDTVLIGYAKKSKFH